ncbi:MAG: copper chaperone PCu(A)C, partial [Nevskiaceae bacterium]
ASVAASGVATVAWLGIAVAFGVWTVPVASAAGPAAVSTSAVLDIREAWLRPSLPGVPVGAGYLTIVNNAAVADELLEVATSRASMVQVHETRREQNVMRMREVERLVIAPRSRVVLAPNGTHLMLMGLTEPLRVGEKLPITLRFARDGERTVIFEVRELR